MENKESEVVNNTVNKPVKKTFFQDKKGLIIGIIVLVVIIVVALVIVLNLKGKDKKEEGNDESGKIINSTEQTVEDEYGFTKQEAIDTIKQIYNSDNYTFSAQLRKDNMYIVTVTDTVTNTKTNYVVDPNDGTFTLEDLSE